VKIWQRLNWTHWFSGDKPDLPDNGIPKLELGNENFQRPSPSEKPAAFLDKRLFPAYMM
jgi:hypothetical protein